MAELALLIRVGQAIGVLSTLALLILTAMVGIALLQRQGYSALVSARRKMEQGRLPAEEMVSGMFLAAAGILFLTPGFITDFFGLCCLIPGIRRMFLARLLRHRPAAPFASQSTREADSRVIEGEFERERRDPDK
jgi:UPF0716 protein FxsA